jgi:hypothetical protein
MERAFPRNESLTGTHFDFGEDYFIRKNDMFLLQFDQKAF